MKHKLGFLLALGFTSQAFAADNLLTLFVRANGNTATMAGYERSLTGTIIDEAIKPNAIAMFNTPDITDFHVDVVGPITNFEYWLADNFFAPDGKFSKGLRFDENANPVFFETLGFWACTSRGDFYDTVIDDQKRHPETSLYSYFERDMVMRQDGTFGYLLARRQTSLPDPEPETYAMVLASLGLMGFMTRSRWR
jgi:hypothetical protein